MSSAVCEIEFEKNPSKVVYSGQLVRGNVHLTLTEATESVQNISLRFRGAAYCRWTDGFQDDKETFTSSENYLNERIYLVRGREGAIFFLFC